MIAKLRGLALAATVLLAAPGCSSGPRTWVDCADRTCGICHGTGAYQCAKCGSNEWAGKLKCPRCNLGTARDLHGAPITCPHCEGTGKIPCDRCDGKGEIRHGEWVSRE